jgi:hypothetical protein
VTALAAAPVSSCATTGPRARPTGLDRFVGHVLAAFDPTLALTLVATAHIDQEQARLLQYWEQRCERAAYAVGLTAASKVAAFAIRSGSLGQKWRRSSFGVYRTKFRLRCTSHPDFFS